MAQSEGPTKIFSATYSNVPVYEFNYGGNHVMRRRSDNWINATHILKVADFDKPARTRILEREVQKGIHEKVQGGYGKYQGTWVPLQDGRDLADRNGVLAQLLPIFDYVPGDVSPPQAPKHTTAASNKPRVPKAPGARRTHKPPPAPSLISEDQYSMVSAQLHDDDNTPDNSTVVSLDYDEDEYPQASQHSVGSRKRKRGMPDQVARNSMAERAEIEHTYYADALLDYFMVADQDGMGPPVPPPNFKVDRPIDDHGNAALHWAAAMGDIDVVKDLIGRGASIDARTERQETPLMRAVMFTNNHEKGTMPKLMSLLRPTVELRDICGSNVFHHIAATTCSRSKNDCARYYQDSIINKLGESMSKHDISVLLDTPDGDGNTALHIAANNGSKKCVRSLIGHGASSAVTNHQGQVAEHLIQTLLARRTDRYPAHSSSPFQPPAMLELDGSQSRPLAFSYDTVPPVSSLTQTIIPLIQEKTERLTEACDAEMKEKDDALEEGQQGLRSLQLQLQEAESATCDLASIQHDIAADQQDAEELQMLEQEIEDLLEQQQYIELSRAFHAEEMRLHPSKKAMTSSLSPEEFEEKLEVAHHLARQQEERRALVKEVVQHMAKAGASEKQAKYRYLLSRTMDVAENEVASMLPDVLSCLKEDAGEDLVLDGSIYVN